MNGNQIRSARREVKVPRTRDESGGHDPEHGYINLYSGIVLVGVLPSGCAHNAQPLILAQNRAELELEELGDVPDEGEDLSHSIVNGRHRCEEVDDSFRDRLGSLHTWR